LKIGKQIDLLISEGLFVFLLYLCPIYFVGVADGVTLGTGVTLAKGVVGVRGVLVGGRVAVGVTILTGMTNT